MTDPIFTLRLADAIHALADECERTREGTMDLGSRIAAALGRPAYCRIVADTSVAVGYLHDYQWWEITYSARIKSAKPYYVSLNALEDRVVSNAATLPLAICAAMLLLEERRLRREAARLPWNEPGEGEPDV